MAQLIVGVNDLATTHPELAAQLVIGKNEKLAHEFTAGSRYIGVWQCDLKHEWEAMTNKRSRVRGTGCPVCSGKRILAGFNDLATTHPDIASQLVTSENEKSAQELSSGARDMRFWFGECGHTWKSVVYNRASGSGCSVCHGKQILVGINDLATTHPHIASQLVVDKNEKTAQELTQGSEQMCSWRGECGHTWKATVNNLTNGQNCAVCRGLQVNIGVNDLATTHPNIAKQLIVGKDEKTAKELTAGSNSMRLWLGECGHEWAAKVINRANQGTGCSTCSTGKTERSLMELFNEYSNHSFNTVNLLSMPRRLRKRDRIQIDGINEELKLIIEFDGAWSHSGNTVNKVTSEQKLDEDADTTEVLLNAGYKVIRIREMPLDFITVNADYLNDISLTQNLYQVGFKHNGYVMSHRDDMVKMVKSICEEKADWFTSVAN